MQQPVWCSVNAQTPECQRPDALARVLLKGRHVTPPWEDPHLMNSPILSIRVPAPEDFETRESGLHRVSVLPRINHRPAAMRDVVGSSERLTEVFEMVDRVADTSCTVLVTGESGTGKELVARALHQGGSRAKEPFVAVNCGAIPENLLESELFGHARGAFTGAHATKTGRVAAAEGGTLFLDEIGELPLGLQVKLLRLLQAHEYSPVGDMRVYKANVRIVAATNIDLEQAVHESTFREDLYYRLNVVQLHMPPLRARLEDISPLVRHFLYKAREKTGRMDILGVSREAMELLVTWQWPGNVRELENTIERAVLLCGTSKIGPEDLPPRVRGATTENRVGAALPQTGLDLRTAVEDFENGLIRQALDRTGWNKNQAAKLLGLNRTTLVEMIKRKRIVAKAA